MNSHIDTSFFSNKNQNFLATIDRPNKAIHTFFEFYAFYCEVVQIQMRWHFVGYETVDGPSRSCYQINAIG